jgi:hypothetical protein
VADGRAASLHHHLFVRPDGDQVLLVWDRAGKPTVDIAVRREAATATEYRLDGTASPVRLVNGRTIERVSLSPGRTRIFRLHAR